MALEKVLSRDFVLNVNTGTEGSPTWTKIGGRKDLTMSVSTDKIDLSDCDSDGADERIVGHAVSFAVTANRLEDPDTGERDSGQAAVEAVQWETGEEARLQFQITSPGGLIWIFTASVECQPFGGDHKSGANWSATLSVKGIPAESGS